MELNYSQDVYDLDYEQAINLLWDRVDSRRTCTTLAFGQLAIDVVIEESLCSIQ